MLSLCSEFGYVVYVFWVRLWWLSVIFILFFLIILVWWCLEVSDVCMKVFIFDGWLSVGGIKFGSIWFVYINMKICYWELKLYFDLLGYFISGIYVNNFVIYRNVFLFVSKKVGICFVDGYKILDEELCC